MFQPPLSPECLVAQVVKYKLSHQHEQIYSCYFSWSGVCSSSLCLRGIPPASHSYALFGHHPPGSRLWAIKEWVNTNRWHHICRMTRINWRMTSEWTQHFGPKKCVITLSLRLGGLCNDIVPTYTLSILNIPKIWNGCHSGGRLGSWSCRLWGGVLHARTPDKSRLANAWGCFKARALDQQTRTEDDSHLF